MTKRTATTDWNLEDLNDDDLEAYADWLEGRTPKVRLVGRDALGRYCRQMHRDAVGTWINVAGTSHSHTRCGTYLRDTRRGGTVTVSNRPAGWLCSGCVYVEPLSIAMASAHLPVNTGTQVCPSCDTEKSVRKFPTVLRYGFIVDRGTECRDCCQPWRNRPATVVDPAPVAC